MDNDSKHFDWTVRNAVYAAILERTVPPSAEETAAALSVSPDDVRAAYERLNDRHALFLTPGSHDVRMAHPSPAYRPRFGSSPATHLLGELRVGRARHPAALHADARIEAPIGDGESIRFAIEAGRVKGWDGVVHYPLPFRRWYDDLIET